MDLEIIRNYCLSKKAVKECMPFGNDTLVFKVMGKMFLLTGIDSSPLEINVKCEPEKAIELRENFSCVKPGYHMNKQHWNTVTCDHSVTDQQLKEWIDDSYNLVVASLPKKIQTQLKLL
ncbi:MAG: MmcQ/YjbR family DNA-binding protein [Bacteroidota bacterium]|jgi:predicted DNA-binding protein (MmcQ/YjbR family)|nr:MmcQ/YjbR family DNA-binding protein [Bacteroidota bacterium]